MDIIKTKRKTILEDESYLRQTSKPVDFSDSNYEDDLKIISDFCNQNECFALAAVQVGIPKRIIFLKNTSLDIPIEDHAYNEEKILINPVIKSRTGHTRYWEACLSCLDYMGLVDRPYEIDLEYYDEKGIINNKKFIGFEATVLSHELDHLDGILHMDIASELLEMPKEERKIFRKSNPYQIISKTCDFNAIK